MKSFTFGFLRGHANPWTRNPWTSGPVDRYANPWTGIPGPAGLDRHTEDRPASGIHNNMSK